MATLTGRSVAMPTRQTKPVNPHYQSDEHIAWRNTVIARAGRHCERCGATGVRLFADHIVELTDGGHPFDLANGQALCGSCHTNKTNAERIKRHGLAQP